MEKLYTLLKKFQQCVQQIAISTNSNLLLCVIKKCELVVALVVFKKLFLYSILLTKYLESEGIDLTNVEHTVGTLQSIRQAEASLIYEAAETMDKAHDVPISVQY